MAWWLLGKIVTPRRNNRGFTEWAIDATAQLFDVGIAAGNLQPFDTHNVARALTTASRVTTAR
jgi:hypothetical protein